MILATMAKLATVLSLLIILTCCSRTQTCERVTEVAADSAMVVRIEQWVDQQRAGRLLMKDHAVPSRMVRPGSYSVAVPPEIKWVPAVEARVLTDPDGTPRGVFLGEYDLQGLVVDFDTQEDFLLPPDKLQPVTPRTSTICIERD